MTSEISGIDSLLQANMVWCIAVNTADNVYNITEAERAKEWRISGDGSAYYVSLKKSEKIRRESIREADTIRKISLTSSNTYHF